MAPGRLGGRNRWAAITIGWREVVTETMEPAAVSVWVRS